MFIDTHCHLNLIAKKDYNDEFNEKYFEIIENIIKESKKKGVTSFITIGTDLNESVNCVNIAKKFKEVYAVIGIHPCDAAENWIEDFEKIQFLVKKQVENKVVGIGETGLDFYHKPYDKERQIKVFENHIELAIKKDLPLVVHVRESALDVFNILHTYKNQAKGVIHCFSQDKDFAKKFLDLGFYLGLNAPVTYPKNEWFREVVKFIPLDRILLETDAPFLPPQEFRGKKNSPEYIPIFAQTIADLKNISLEELARETTGNAKDLFRI